MEKYALVTGASSGIGREYARQLARRGYAVLLVSDRREENECAAREIAAAEGVRTEAICLDLATPDAAERLWTWCCERRLEVEVLVCNAGMLLFGGFAAGDPARIERLVTLHCTTAALLCRYFGAAMCRRGRGYLLIMSSATAWMPYPTIALYAATKSFLRSLAQALHTEFAPCGVRVTAVFPGAVDTPLYRLDERMRRRLVRFGVMQTPQEVARRGLRALFRGRRRTIPGLFTRLCVTLCRFVPAWAIAFALRLPAVKKLL